jgi:hypothetical protein
MTVSFNPLKATGDLFTHLPELDDLESSLSNANAADVLDALGIEDTFSASPWPLPCFKALLVVARRKRLGHASPAIPVTETRETGSTTGCSATPSLSACATTSPRTRCGENGPPDSYSAMLSGIPRTRAFTRS